MTRTIYLWLGSISDDLRLKLTPAMHCNTIRHSVCDYVTEAVIARRI